MAADEINSAAADDPGEPSRVEVSPAEPEPQSSDDSTPAPKQGWSRRAFFQAASLGAAAAAFLEGKRFVPSPALAHIVTGVNCRANDVRITGAARIINEACNCTGTFTAQVQIPISNNTGTNRYCVTLHLCEGRNLLGDLVYPATDILLGTIPPGTSMYTFSLPNYPCGQAQVCFGTFVEDGRTSCPSGCCTVVSWATTPTAPGSCPANADPSPSKCRIQQVCIVGRGAVLTCNDAGCVVPCGGTATLTLCGTGGTGTYNTFVLKDDATPTPNTYAPVSVAGNCATFSVPNINRTTTFKGTATDSGGCAQDSNQRTVTTTALSKPTLEKTTGPDCDGNVTVTASPSGLAKYEFKVDSGGFVDNGTNPVFSTMLSKGPTHHITVKTSNSAGCSNTSDPLDVAVPTAVSTVDPQLVGPTCVAEVTLTASASGGVAPYTIEWFDNGNATPIGSGSPLVKTLGVGSHTITVKATDSKGCASAVTGFVGNDITVNPPVTVSAAKTGGPNCAGQVELTATPGGGNNDYTFEWFDADSATPDTPIGTSNPLTITLASGPHHIKVKVKDTSTNHCPATSNTLSIPINPAVTVSAAKTAGPTCAGQVTLTATPGGGNGSYTFEWFDTDSATPDTPIGTSNPLTITLTPGSHHIKVKVKDTSANQCPATSNTLSVPINDPITVVLGAPTQDNCSGALSLTVTASGGAGGYDFALNGASGTIIGSGSSRTVHLSAQLDGTCRTVSVTVTDSATCTGTSNERSFSQCVTTTDCD